jgi:predicted nucleotidyltransferase
VSVVDIVGGVIESESEGCIGYEVNATGKVEGSTLRGEVGIEVSGSSRVNVVGANFEVERLGAGYWEQSGGMIEKSRITGTGTGGATGVDIAGVVELDIKDSEISKVICGVRVDEEARVNISRTKIRNEKDAIEIGAQCTVNVSDSEIMVKQLGIGYRGQSVGRVERCVIEKDGDKDGNGSSLGINTSGMAEVAFQDNSIRGIGCGIKCDEDSKANIMGGRIHAVKTGIDAGGRTKVNVWNCTLESERFGIVCHDESMSLIENNRITAVSSAASCGINILGQAGAEIRKNDLRQLTYGIVNCSTARTMLEDNKIRARKKYLEKDENILDNEDVLPDVKNILEEKVGNRLIRWLHGFVLRTWQYPGIRSAYRLLYRLALRVVTAGFAKVRGVRSIYLRRGLASQDWIPGLSDIDLFLVVDDTNAGEEQDLIGRIGDTHFRLKKIVPFVGEVQIGTERELRNYFTWGDIRAFEAPKTWRLLYGKPVTGGDYARDANKLRIDAVTEMLNLYRIFGEVYFDGVRSCQAKHIFVKTFIDILKYRRYAVQDGGEVINGRVQTLDACLAESTDAAERALLETMRRVRRQNAALEKPVCDKAFLYIFDLLETAVRDFNRLVAPADDAVEPACASSRAGAVTETAAGDRLARWERFSEELRARDSRRQVRGVIMDDPGLCYIIAEWNKTDGQCFLETMTSVQSFVRTKNVTRRTACIVLTPEMYQALLFSLHFESPFHYYKLPRASSGCVVTIRRNEERLASNMSQDDFAAPGRRHIGLLAKETVALMSISVRMFERMVPVNNLHKVVYLYSRILALQLVMEKGRIAEPYLEDILACCGEYYPEQREWLARFADKYLARPAHEINAASPLQVFNENYPFLADILRRLNTALSEDTLHGQCGQC